MIEKKESFRNKLGFILLVLIMIIAIGVIFYGVYYSISNIGNDADHPIRDIIIGQYAIVSEPVYKDGQVYFQMNDSVGIIKYYAMHQKYYQEYFPSGIHKGDVVEFTKNKGIILETPE